MRQIVDFAEIAQSVTSSFRSDLTSAGLRWVGLENEYLLVGSDGNIAPREVLDYLWHELICMGWEGVTDELLGHVVGVRRNRVELENLKSHHYDFVTTDLGYAILEVDLAPAPSLLVAHTHLAHLLHCITTILSYYNVYVLGYGVQPIATPGEAYLGQKSRYALMLDICRQENVLQAGEWRGVDLHTIDASCQTQVEVSSTEAIPVVNALNATSGLRIALLANSSVWQNKIAEQKAVRLMFVDWCWPSRKLQLGMPPRFQNIEHYLDYILDFRALIVRRQQHLYKIDNNQAFRQFFTAEQGQIGVALNGHEERLFADRTDIITQCGLAWFHTRLQPAYGTVEDRVSCQQPPQAHLCASALTLGLVQNHAATSGLAGCLSRDQWAEVHLLACQHGLDFSYPGIDLLTLIERLLAIADTGLRMRGLGEEIYLAPLYERLATCSCPADDIRRQFSHKGVTGIVASNDMRNWL